MTKTGKNIEAMRMTKLIAGTKKHYPNGKQSLQFANGAHTVDEVTASMQSIVDNRAATEAAQATAAERVAAERAQHPALIALVNAFVALVRATYGKSAEVLGDFGLAPPKPRAVQTAQQKAVAAAKRDATRAARGTKGSKAKKSVKGTVTTTVVVTPVAPAPPTPPVPSTSGGTSTGHGQ